MLAQLDFTAIERLVSVVGVAPAILVGIAFFCWRYGVPLVNRLVDGHLNHVSSVSKCMEQQTEILGKVDSKLDRLAAGDGCRHVSIDELAGQKARPPCPTTST